MYYFAGAIHSEEQRMTGSAGDRDEFLLSHHPSFRDAVERGYEQLLNLAGGATSAAVTVYERQVARDIAPYNTAGLCDAAKNGMYPYAQTARPDYAADAATAAG